MAFVPPITTAKTSAAQARKNSQAPATRLRDNAVELVAPTVAAPTAGEQQRVTPAASFCFASLAIAAPNSRVFDAVGAKVTVGRTDDPLEREADRTAERALSRPALQQTAQDGRSPLPAAQLSPGLAREVLGSNGRPLDAQSRAFFEPRLQHDLSAVRIHTGPRAERTADRLQARAFTLGHHIAFGAGQHDPHSRAGRGLMGHELAHTIQARSDTSPIIRRQRAPNQSIDPLTALTGESDIYAAPISDRPVEQMSKSEVDDEINRLERWISKQNQSTPDVVKRENRLADLRQRQTELGAAVKAHRATPVVAVKPRCLTESLDITQMTRDEMAAELDSIVQFLRLGPSKSDIAKVTHFKGALEQALEGQRRRENEEVRKRDIALALNPITTGNTYEDFRTVLTVIASIAPDPNNTAQAALHLPNGMTVPVSNDEAIALKTQAAQMIKKYAAQSESLAEDTYQAFEERRQKGKEHPIVHGLVKWRADVDDLDELEMFGKKEQARSMQAQINGLANSGKLIPAFNVSVGLERWSEGYARQVGEWEAALMNSAGRWVLALTILQEGLTLLATAGAGSLISSARVARGVSALRATAEVAGATTFAGTAGAVGGYAASEKFTGGEVTLGGAVKAGRVGGGTGLAIGAAPGVVAATREAFGVGKAATTLGNVGRGVAAEVVGNTPVNVAAAGIQGVSMKDAAISTVTSSTISGAGSQAVAKIAKGSKVVSTVAGAGVGGTAATAGALATGKDARDTVIAGAFGTAGGALGPHLEESNKNYLEGRSSGSSTEGAPKPPTTDERFDFSDRATSSDARSGGSAPPAESGVGGKFDLSEVGGSPPADQGSGPKAATTGTTRGTRTTSATSVTSQSSGSQSKTGYSRTAPTSEEEIASAAGRTQRRVGAIDRGKGARPWYANDPVKPKVRPAAGLPSPEEDAIIKAYSRGLSDLRQRIAAKQRAEAAAPRNDKLVQRSRAAYESADKALQAIEDQAVNRPDGEELVDHLYPLTEERRKLKEPQGLLATQTGEQIKCEAVDEAPNNLRGMDFADIESAMKRPPDSVDAAGLDDARQPSGHQRLEWRFEDGSRLVIDKPRPQTDEEKAMHPRPASADLPHAELHGPKGERLDEQGITVAVDSISTHMTITDHTGALEKHFAPARAGTK